MTSTRRPRRVRAGSPHPHVVELPSRAFVSDRLDALTAHLTGAMVIAHATRGCAV